MYSFFKFLSKFVFNNGYLLGLQYFSRVECNFLQDTPVSVNKSYSFRAGKLDKQYNIYENDIRIASLVYCKGQLTGYIKTYHDNCIISSKVYYRNNIMCGAYRFWHENGSPHMLYTCKQGVINGPFIMWYSNGNIQTYFTFKNNKPYGVYLMWYENGILTMKCYYDHNSDVVGIYKMWEADGNRIHTANYPDSRNVSRSPEPTYLANYVRGKKEYMGIPLDLKKSLEIFYKNYPID